MSETSEKISDVVLAIRARPLGNAALELLEIMDKGAIVVNAYSRKLSFWGKDMDYLGIDKFWISRLEEVLNSLISREYIDKYLPRGKYRSELKTLEPSAVKRLEQTGKLACLNYFFTINSDGKAALKNNAERLEQIKAAQEKLNRDPQFIVALQRGNADRSIAAGNLYRVIKETNDRYYIDNNRLEGVPQSELSDFIHFNFNGGKYIYFIPKNECFAHNVSVEQYKNIIDTVNYAREQISLEQNSINGQIEALKDKLNSIEQNISEQTSKEIQNIIENGAKEEVDNSVVVLDKEDLTGMFKP